MNPAVANFQNRFWKFATVGCSRMKLSFASGAGFSRATHKTEMHPIHPLFSLYLIPTLYEVELNTVLRADI
jgi:hypothetical protein